jgi:hypothetical protein
VIVKKVLTMGACLLIAMLTAICPAFVPAVAAYDNEPIVDEAVIRTLLEKTYVTTKIFTGGDKKWDCEFTVRETLATAAGSPGPPCVEMLLAPKFTYSKYYIRHFDYLLTTTNGCLSGAKWLHSGEMIAVETAGPIPEKDETIAVKVSEWSKTSAFNLTNRIPDGAITPQAAFRKAWVVHYETYGTYPTTLFTFMIEFVDQKYWLIVWDDGDGIGGASYLLVNAFTGEAGAIKVDEG